MLLPIEPGLFLDLLTGAVVRMAGPAWGQKGCYFPFHFSVDMLTSPAIFSFVCGLKRSRIFKEKEEYVWWEGGSGSRQKGRGPFMALFF